MSERITAVTQEHGELVTDDPDTELEELRAKVERVRAIHTKDPEVHIDTIHRGLTPVYGDGCSECGVAWPCDTIEALDS